MNLPFSLPEAQNLCREYQYLVGTAFDGSNVRIEAVIITPFDTGYKQRFFAYYLLFDNDAAMAIEEYKGTLYDVALLAETADGHLLNESLSVWGLKNNIFVSPAGNIVSQSQSNQAYL